MSQSAAFLPDAAEQFRSAVDFAFEDMDQQRLRYHLLRLTVAGLSQQDVEELGEISRLAFTDGDVSAAADRLRQRADARPLAVVLADLAQAAASGAGRRASVRSVLLGAILGAYAGLREIEGMGRSQVAILGAVGGAVAVAAVDVALEIADRVGADDYARVEE
jgi:hypothetical protein